MKVLLGIPRHRFIWPASEMWLVESILTLTNSWWGGVGWEVGVVAADVLQECYLDEARQKCCAMAIEGRYDVLVMCDADQYLSGADTVKLVQETVRGDYAMLGAPYPCRGRGDPGWMHPREGDRPTLSDLKVMQTALRQGFPLEMRGFVGGSIFALGVKHLLNIPGPWWTRGVLEGDAHKALVGEDVWFSRRALAAGKRIGIHFGLRSGKHWGGFAWTSDRLLDRVEAALERGIAELSTPAPIHEGGNHG